MTDDSLKIPKRPVDVELRDASGRKTQVAVHLADVCANEDRRERLQDVLRERRFIPVRDASGVWFASRAHLMWMKVDLIDGLDELEPETESNDASISAGVRLEFDDGTTLDGGIRYLLPRAARRLGDYLERLPQFFPLRTPESLYLVNRDRVLRATPIDEVLK